MLLQEKKNQVLKSESEQNQEDELSDSSRLIERKIASQQLDYLFTTTTEENWETLSPTNLVKLLSILAIGSLIVFSGEMNNLSCGVSGNQGNSPTLNIK